jgi:hypothetical protein
VALALRAGSRTHAEGEFGDPRLLGIELASAQRGYELLELPAERRQHTLQERTHPRPASPPSASPLFFPDACA